MRNALASLGQMVLAAVVAISVAVISLIAISRVQWPAFPSSNQLHAVTTVGIGLTVHRYLVHRSFKAGPVVKFILCAIGQMACQGSLLKWVGNHRRHHLYTDHVGDPHSPYLDGKGMPFMSKLKSWANSNNGWLFDDTKRYQINLPRWRSGP